MTSQTFRGLLVQGAALIGGGAALTIAASPAVAQSVCQIDPAPSPDTFNCTTGGPSPLTASGTVSDGAHQGEPFIFPQGLVVNSPSLLIVTLSGEIVSTDTDGVLSPRFPPAVMINNNAPVQQGPVVYTSSGRTVSQGSNTIITGTSVVATTGTIVVNGPDLTSPRYGLLSISNNGRSAITGGSTTFTDATHGDSVGIFSAASGGEMVLNTGIVTLPGTGTGNLGVFASSRPSSRGVCDVNGVTVNVTGDVTVNSGIGLKTESCSGSTVKVDAGRTVSTTGPAIVNSAATTATTNVNGTIDAGVNLALDANGASSVTNVASQGIFIGRFDGTSGADTFNNNGQFTTRGVSDYQGGADLFVNNGTLSASGITTFAGLESLSNAGTISLRNGAADDVLTVSGNYSGSAGARLLLDVGALGADRLVIGGAATGSTAVLLTPVGEVRSVNTAGVLLIETESASAGAFTLANAGFSSGLINVALQQRGGDFYLTATPDRAAFEPLSLTNMAKALWYQTADVYNDYAALRRADLRRPRRQAFRFWGQLYASRDHSGSRETVAAFEDTFRVDNRVETNRQGVQLGLDLQPLGKNIVLGATGGLQRARMDMREAAGEFVAKGYNIGAYVHFGRPTGFYAGLLGKFDHNDVRVRRGALGATLGSPNFSAWGAEGEVGYRIPLRSTNLDIGAALARVNARIRPFETEQIGFDFSAARSLRGRLGARAEFHGRWAPYVDAKLFHEFRNEGRLALITGSQRSVVETSARGTWGRLEVGIGGAGEPGLTAALWGEGGQVRGIGAKAGLRF